MTLVAERGSSPPLRILGIGGSTRAGSCSALALRAALRLLDNDVAQTVVADVRELDLPVTNEDWSLADYPPALAWLLSEVRAADAFVLCSPTYHGTISGAVKNVLDALNFLGDDNPPSFGGKPVALMALGGTSAMNVISALHHATRALNGLAVPTVVTMPASAIDSRTHQVRDEAVGRRLQRMTEELIDLVWRLSRPALRTRLAVAPTVGIGAAV